ncbi:hypothetical protein OROMI_001476 [Orobanche minor]
MRDVNWVVKTYTKEHTCLQTRSVKACDYKFLSKQIVQQIETNPEVPIRALREQIQRQYKVDISKMKTFRAKNEAIKHVRGDYATQYKLLRDYALEVQARNPDTTVKIDVETEPNPHVETRTFRRIYFCIGALKKGFAAGRRDFLGLDGAFMKGPYPGQILSAVALDGNNGIYPLASETLEKLKSEANEYIAIFCGDGKYQISGPWQDQCIVDVGNQSCTCKKWELTGMPCKHAIAAIWDMRRNNRKLGIPETFVHPCYWLSTCNDMYSFKIGPINRRPMWMKSPCATTLLPPKHRATIGRPKKKRTKSALEKEDLIRGNKVSRAHKSVTYTKCKNVGHNSRTCKGQRPNVGDGGAKERGNRKGK